MLGANKTINLLKNHTAMGNFTNNFTIDGAIISWGTFAFSDENKKLLVACLWSAFLCINRKLIFGHVRVFSTYNRLWHSIRTYESVVRLVQTWFHITWRTCSCLCLFQKWNFDWSCWGWNLQRQHYYTKTLHPFVSRLYLNSWVPPPVTFIWKVNLQKLNKIFQVTAIVGLGTGLFLGWFNENVM